MEVDWLICMALHWFQRLMMRSGSMDNNSTQAQLLDSLEELDEVYDELEESQIDYPRGRASSSRMSYNNNAGSPSSSIANNNHNRASWMKSAHEIAHGLSLEERCDVAILECKAIQDQMNIYRSISHPPFILVACWLSIFTWISSSSWCWWVISSKHGSRCLHFIFHAAILVYGEV